jgi:uncharacterized protein (TIGR02231 family)
MLTRITVPLLAAVAVLPFWTGSGGPNPADARVSSRIVTATVYTDRAMVTREAKADVTPGRRQITLGGLPPILQDQSVRVSAAGSAQAKILEVKVDQVFLDTVSAARIKPLLRTRKSLNDEIRVLNDRLAVITHQRDFLNKITIASQESIARELRTQKPSADDWGKLLGFFDAEFSKLDAESRQIDEKRSALQEKLEAAEKELASAGGNPEKIEKLITVVFDVQRGGSIAIEASYLISQAGWRPTYDIRVSSADTVVELTYAAFVRQNTGEDWNNVRLTLSTAQPALGGTPPELQPWHVNVLERPKGVTAGAMVTTTEEPAGKDAARMMRKENRPLQAGGAAPAPVAYQTAEVRESLTSASFPITGENAVPADNADHRVTVMIAPLGGSFSHSAVPKLQAEVFFKAALSNSTEYPFLPGPMSVYVDNGFVSISRIPAVMPGEKFDAFLGADNGIHIERKLLNRVTDISGLFSKTRKTRYEILIIAENRKKTAQTLSLLENVPVSQDERVKVEIALPRPEEAAPDANGIITWRIRLAPGERREFKVQYSIEAPIDLTVGGIE